MSFVIAKLMRPPFPHSELLQSSQHVAPALVLPVSSSSAATDCILDKVLAAFRQEQNQLWTQSLLHLELSYREEHASPKRYYSC